MFVRKISLLPILAISIMLITPAAALERVHSIPIPGQSEWENPMLSFESMEGVSEDTWAEFCNLYVEHIGGPYQSEQFDPFEELERGQRCLEAGYVAPEAYSAHEATEAAVRQQVVDSISCDLLKESMLDEDFSIWLTPEHYELLPECNLGAEHWEAYRDYHRLWPEWISWDTYRDDFDAEWAVMVLAPIPEDQLLPEEVELVKEMNTQKEN